MQISWGQSILCQDGYWEFFFSQDQTYSLEIPTLQILREIWICGHPLQTDRCTIGQYLNKTTVNEAFLPLVTCSADGFIPNNQSRIRRIINHKGVQKIHRQDPNDIGFPIILLVFADASQAFHSCTSTHHGYECFLIIVTLNQNPFCGSKNVVVLLTNVPGY